MAQWTGSTSIEVRPYSNYTAPLIREFEESTAGATAVIRRGDLVSFDTLVATASHRILRTPSSGGDGTNLMQVNVKSFVGVALQDSTSDGTDNGLSTVTGQLSARRISVCLATPNQTFLAYASSMAPASSAAGHVLVGRNVPIIHDRAYSRFMVATANATAALAAAQIVGVPDYAIGDSGTYPVIIKFLSTNLSPVVPGATQ